jgi:hypothetical protein
MAHLFTIRVPEGYRGSGGPYAISVFTDDDTAGDRSAAGVMRDAEQQPVDDERGYEFWKAVRAYLADPREIERYVDDHSVDRGWAILLLNEHQFRDATADLPAGTPSAIHGLTAQSHDAPAVHLSLRERTDPNAGLAPEEFPLWLDHFDASSAKEGALPGYVPVFSSVGRVLSLPERSSAWSRCHFGGTLLAQQCYPKLSARYLEFDDQLGGANLGDGSAQIDLEGFRVHWG